jgi:hypothetical protein
LKSNAVFLALAEVVELIYLEPEVLLCTQVQVMMERSRRVLWQQDEEGSVSLAVRKSCERVGGRIGLEDEWWKRYL